jgi:hypothetical protein
VAEKEQEREKERERERERDGGKEIDSPICLRLFTQHLSIVSLSPGESASDRKGETRVIETKQIDPN